MGKESNGMKYKRSNSDKIEVLERRFAVNMNAVYYDQTLFHEGKEVLFTHDNGNEGFDTFVYGKKIKNSSTKICKVEDMLFPNF
jgi:hypothetical protein